MNHDHNVDYQMEILYRIYTVERVRFLMLYANQTSAISGDRCDDIGRTPGIHDTEIIELIDHSGNFEIAHDMRTTSFLDSHLRTK